ncbi:MMPL family transporter [Cellulomonas fengjieae]|uniref:MMPL family transporter n=1 Tax=Cellulomonas fengjieae TaxID=2819978 RepID=A0ABS3SIJ9_9CELL|nr:MMPL family transporter [Cellulomonas fengjieae]MBO3085472.1 MMPL family transporter [Cellulomonas fengjieae]QVI64481.1 MMPL family transporter [Cellulomonas fengjieae]
MKSTWAMRRPWWAVTFWILLIVALQAASAAFGSAYYDDHTLPGTESQRVSDRLEQSGEPTLDTVAVVFHGAAPVAEDAAVEAALGEIEELPGVESVQAPAVDAHSVSDDGRIAYATVTLETTPLETDPADVRGILDVAEEHATDEVGIELSGASVRGAQESGGAAEGIGILAALVILVFLFGSLVAASLPILSAVLAVGSSIGAAALVSHVTAVPTYAAPMMMLVGLGVGIDYALLIFSRFRSELLAGRPRTEAAIVAQRTAGRSVMFAGATVVIALLGLVVLGLGALRGLAIAVAVTVLMTMLASATLLPALLTLFGGRIERSVRRRAARGRGREADRWRALSDAIARRPWPALVGGVLVLVALTVPMFSLRLGFADAGTDPAGSTTREAYDLLAQGFGAGANGPLVVLAEAPEAEAAGAAEAIRETPGVADVVGPIPGDDGSTVIVFPETGPADDATIDLVHRLRDDVLPAVADEGRFSVGGSTAAAIDFAEGVSDRMPWFVAVVVGISSLLLMTVFRSLLIPLKAAALNLLSIGAALGVMQLVYGEGTLGQAPGPIEAFLPVIVFAVVFGLSMDYEVFLMSRMHEEWRRSGDARHAVREGLAGTGTVITAAAAIMVVVFGSFMLSPSRMLGQMGLGLAVAVLLDAAVVRCLVVPAVMHLFGERAWWLPGPLGRILPTIRLEDPALEAATPSTNPQYARTTSA